MTATSAIIPASGLGKRISSSSSGKCFINLAGEPLIAHTIAVFQNHRDINDIVIVVRPDDYDAISKLVETYNFAKVHAIVIGGKERQDSVRNGLAVVSKDSSIVAIHDGARPLVTDQIITDSINAASSYKAAIVAVPVIDTIKLSQDSNFISNTLERDKLFSVQTPQTFSTDLLRAAYDRALSDNFTGTDDASLVERLGVPIKIVHGSYENLKVTTPSDITLAEAIMTQRATHDETTKIPNIRIGHGYDIHRFEQGRELYLGGVHFEGEEGLLGHSDADVLLHAVADALLGAASAGDIGVHFPDTDSTYKNARSLELLASTGHILEKLGWSTINIDVTLIAQRPRVAKHTSQMCANIASALNISIDQVSVKATTAEGLGAIGEGLGIECHAVALIQHI